MQDELVFCDWVVIYKIFYTEFKIFTTRLKFNYILGYESCLEFVGS